MEENKITITVEEYNALRDALLRSKIARDILNYVEVGAYNDKANALLDAAIRTLDPDYKADAGEVDA